jgi:hypothetical protein
MKKKSFSLGIFIIILLLVYSYNDQNTKSAEFETPTLDSDTYLNTKPKVELADSSVISYAEAAEWLEQLDPEEHDDQIRDWAVIGLAALLNVDTETFRDYAYDKTPIRDSIFSDLAENLIDTGRQFVDGYSMLHLMVPKDGLHVARTIGLLLDDYRKDSGNDPERVQIHRYQIDKGSQEVVLYSEQPRATDDIRVEHGYYEQQFGTLADVENFLNKTRHLSRFEIREGKLWASGWLWPGTPSGKITAEDLTILQQGYQNAKSNFTSEPGFSLDPGLAGIDPLINALDPLVYLEILPAFLEGAKILDSNPADYENYLLKLPLHQQKLLNALFSALDGEPGYQSARYDGGLKGTEAGMTYFYTDIVAKSWPMEIGEGSPSGKVPGFISDLKAQTPWGHCSSMEESGRLWFGLRENAVAIYEDRVDFGDVATRLFSLIKNPNAPDEEIEPSYTFGRIMWWWDRHYVAMADYEPQYHRLDQLMRWGTAIGWLVEHKWQRLPELSEEKINDRLNFGDWLNAHTELKWRYDIPFVNPEGVYTEALLTLQSQFYSTCGHDYLYWAGGISNPARHRSSSILKSRPKVDTRAARGGMDKFYTDYSKVTKSGSIGNEKIVRDLGKIQNKSSSVGVKANGRKVWSFGDTKVWVKETVPRRLNLNLTADAGRITQRIELHGTRIGELSVTAKANSATVLWKPDLMARFRQVLSSVQERLNLSGRSLREAAYGSKGGSLIYTEPGTGRTLLRINGSSKPRWVALEEGEQIAGNSMAFRLAGPNPSGVGPKFYTAQIVDSPKLFSADGSAAKWLSIESGSAKGPARISGTNAPPQGTRPLTFEYPGGKQGILFAKDNRFWARANDPVFGLNSTGEGTTLLNKASIEQVAKVRLVAQSAGDGYPQATLLPDGKVGIVASKKAFLVEKTHPWHQRLKTALGQGKNKSVPVKVVDQKIAIVGKLDIGKIGSPQGTVNLKDYVEVVKEAYTNIRARAPPGPPVFIRNQQAALILEEGKIPAGFLGKKWQVRVLEIKPKTRKLETAAFPDVTIWDKTEWITLSKTLPSAGIESIRIIYQSSDCENGETYLRCSNF